MQHVWTGNGCNQYRHGPEGSVGVLEVNVMYIYPGSEMQHIFTSRKWM